MVYVGEAVVFHKVSPLPPTRFPGGHSTTQRARGARERRSSSTRRTAAPKTAEDPHFFFALVALISDAVFVQGEEPSKGKTTPRWGAHPEEGALSRVIWGSLEPPLHFSLRRALTKHTLRASHRGLWGSQPHPLSLSITILGHLTLDHSMRGVCAGAGASCNTRGPGCTSRHHEARVRSPYPFCPFGGCLFSFDTLHTPTGEVAKAIWPWVTQSN